MDCIGCPVVQNQMESQKEPKMKEHSSIGIVLWGPK